MKLLTSETKQQQLEWRRAQVLELASEGYSQREIASTAKESLQKHIHETVPEEYQKYMTHIQKWQAHPIKQSNRRTTSVRRS
jgi:hypothetical protein